MAVTAYCNMCERTVYVEGDAERFCPVCASPVAEVAEAAGEEPVADAPVG